MAGSVDFLRHCGDDSLRSSHLPKMITRYSITKSGNSKTGAATINTRSTSETCPATCPHKMAGTCYAKQGHERLWWDRLDRNDGIKSGDWLWLHSQLKELKPKPGTLLRHNTAGDLSHDGNGKILQTPLQMLAGMFVESGVVPYTYTHHRQDEWNLLMVRDATAAGFTVNLSCDTEAQASQRHRQGYASTVVVAHDDERTQWRDEHGCAFVVCPAQTREGMTCDRCRLCAKADRGAVVAFRAHGAKRKKTSARLETVG